MPGVLVAVVAHRRVVVVVVVVVVACEPHVVVLPAVVAFVAPGLALVVFSGSHLPAANASLDLSAPWFPSLCLVQLVRLQNGSALAISASTLLTSVTFAPWHPASAAVLATHACSLASLMMCVLNVS